VARAAAQGVSGGDARHSYRISADPEQVASERARLGQLTTLRDPRTRELLARTGVGPGWRCLEVGAGSGTIAAWLGERVLPGGSVISLDVDTRFHGPAGPNVEIRQRDVTEGSLGRGEYDLVHARALLQHLHQREAVLDRMVEALAPGGWIALEEPDFALFLDQELPEPFATLSRASLRSSEQRSGWDPFCGRRLLGWLRARGLEQCDASGYAWTMRGGTPSAEWYVAGLARMRQAGMPAPGGLSPELVDRALSQARSPDFAILSPVSMAAVGRKPRS
jgi:SAM-dependent methyltransferase